MRRYYVEFKLNLKSTKVGGRCSSELLNSFLDKYCDALKENKGSPIDSEISKALLVDFEKNDIEISTEVEFLSEDSGDANTFVVRACAAFNELRYQLRDASLATFTIKGP